MENFRTGVIIGKFCPPHYGHTYMIDYAASFCDVLHVLVYTLKTESLSGYKRYSALKQHYVKHYPEFNEKIHIHWIEKPMPQQPEDHPDFWNIWREDIQFQVKDHIDCIFGSENYVNTLGEYLGCKSKIVDLERNIVPISGTKCREDNFKNWDYIIPEFRHYLVKKICFVGGESTGKSTMARLMAKIFKTEWVPEYARELCKAKDPKEFVSIDFIKIAMKQLENENKLINDAYKYLFCDTDPITTHCFHKLYLGEFYKPLEDYISISDYDLYFLLAPTIPFDQDGTRDFPEFREDQFNLLKEMLDKYQKKYIIINEPNIDKRIHLIKNEILNKFEKN